MCYFHKVLSTKRAHHEVEPQLGVTEPHDIYSWINSGISSHNIKQKTFDTEATGASVLLFSVRSRLIQYLVGRYYLKPAAQYLPNTKRHNFFKTSEQPYIELARWNWITDSLVFSAPEV